MPGAPSGCPLGPRIFSRNGRETTIPTPPIPALRSRFLSRWRRSRRARRRPRHPEVRPPPAPSRPHERCYSRVRAPWPKPGRPTTRRNRAQNYAHKTPKTLNKTQLCLHLPFSVYLQPIICPIPSTPNVTFLPFCPHRILSSTRRHTKQSTYSRTQSTHRYTKQSTHRRTPEACFSPDP